MRTSLRTACWRIGIVALLAASAGAQGTQRVSLGSGGLEGNDHCMWAAISGNGRWVAFASLASNFTAIDATGPDMFVRDRLTGAFECVSVGNGGIQGNGRSGEGPLCFSISDDGRWVTYTSTSDNLVFGDTNNDADIFLRDRQLGTTERLSQSLAGVQADDFSDHNAITPDGRYVVFHSLATNLVAGDTNQFDDVFLLDRTLGTMEIVSLASNGAQGNRSSDFPTISANGRWVCFTSDSTNLVPGDTNQRVDIFVRDRLLGTTERVSVDSAGAQAADNSFWPSISADGRFVTFVSFASNLVPGDTNGSTDVFVHDRQLGTTERASVTSSGQETHGSDDFGLTAWSALSPDGRYVVFESTAHDVVPGDTNGTSDVFLRDRQLGTTERVSLGSAGQQGDFQSSWPGISADGRYVVFLSRATNLVPGDTNAKIDVFVRDGPISFSTFCSGDDTGTACPCGNAGVAGQGCASSAAPQGARLTATGGPSIGDDTLVLAGSSMPNAAALYFQGTTRQNGGLGVVFGDGLRCAGGTIHRLATKLNAGGASQFPGAGDASVSARGIVTAVGTRTYQVWYRNAAAFCTSSTFNLSNGLEIVWSF